ncbi:unnamed protein product [Symbiodinium sp. CCMP2592]|nr:unnamed protein product [Symbiodinium sp. CCMP2592]
MVSEWWQDYKNLFSFANRTLESLDGMNACFHLLKEGSPVFSDDSVLVRARILQELQTVVADDRVEVLAADSPQRLAVLRMSYANWHAVGQHGQSFRALWTGVRVQGDIVILDTTTGPAFLTSDVAFREHETIQVAELFSGGFAGWSQASWIISNMGAPVRTSWVLDIEDHLLPPLQAMDPSLQKAESRRELDALDVEQGPVALLANAEHTWWHGIWARAAPHLLAVSPPCQPWSGAGSGQGLESPDGRLLLLVAAVMTVVRVPVVCIEEVAGFSSHVHFDVVMAAWREAGYDLVARQELQLAEVAPTWRRRLMLILVHRETGPQVPDMPCFVPWQPVPRPSLALMKAYFPILPSGLATPCQLSRELLQVYLDPWYMPPNQKTDAASVRAFRLCNPHQRAKCFMAAYHRQHELPEGLLTRGGLLCSLLTVGEDTRFFSAPEIASCHGAVRTQLLLPDDEQSMRIHGNALAVPQAALTLSNALCWLAPHFHLDPAEVVRQCLEARLHCQNREDWTPPMQIKRATVLNIPTVSAPAACLSAGVANRQGVRDLSLLYTPTARVLIHKACPDVLHQLRWVFENCRAHGLSVACLTCYGVPLPAVCDFPDAAFVVTEADDLFFRALQLRVEPQHAVDWWLQLPCHLLECLGWRGASADPSDKEDMCVQFQAVTSTPVLALPQLKCYLRDLYYLSQVRADARHETSTLYGRLLWTGDVPGELTAACLAKFWHNACRCFGCWPTAQLYSGPFPVDYACPVEHLAARGRVQLKGPRRLLALTVLPETRGGGVKDEQIQLAKSRCASLLLDRGVSLAEVSVAVDRLVSVLGATACLEPLSSAAASRFQRLSQLARAANIDLPPGDNRTEKAAQRIQKAVRRRRLQRTETVLASDFELLPSTWCGIDDQPVPVLTKVCHGCSGVLLVDASVANPQDNALLQNMCSEALCLVVPGHKCPDPDTCSGTCNAPVQHRGTGKKHLLAACYHNVGETDIRPFSEHSVQVDLGDTVCCSFAMYQDETPSDDVWQDISKAPVRAVADRFKSQGIAQPLSQPWGRSFRCNGRPCQPHLCDSLMFHAKVPGHILSKVLQCSGFNRVYVLPRTWDRQLLAGWSVIWLKCGRAEVEKQALLVPGQHGIVRGKSKYGLRVSATAFAKVFQQLRPGEPVPIAVDTKLLFKVGPLPPAAPADALVEWASRLPWQIKVLKNLGPRFWLVGAPQAPPTCTARFNESMVLISAVKSKDVRAPVVQAGGSVPRAPAKTPAPTDVDPWLESDPWSTYRTSQTPSSQASAPALAAPSCVDLQVAGRLQEQDGKIAELERCIGQLRDEQRQAHHDWQQDRQAMSQDLVNVRSEVQGLGAGLQQQLKTSIDSLRAAQAQQDLQMNQGMAELKSLLLAQAEHKKPRLTGDSDL